VRAHLCPAQESPRRAPGRRARGQGPGRADEWLRGLGGKLVSYFLVKVSPTIKESFLHLLGHGPYMLYAGTN